MSGGESSRGGGGGGGASSRILASAYCSITEGRREATGKASERRAPRHWIEEGRGEER